MPAAIDASYRWYVVHTLAGFEAKVVEALGARIEAAGLKAKVSEIVAPPGKVEDGGDEPPARGRRTTYPGYILVHMALSDALEDLVKATPKVTGFLGGRAPTPLSEAEAKALLGKVKEDRDRPARDIYDPGEEVRIIDGPYAQMTGTIESNDRQKRMLRLTVKIFDRMTLVEAAYSQVEKI